MKKSELRKLVSEYNLLKSKKAQTKQTLQKIAQIEQRYYHETGSKITEI